MVSRAEALEMVTARIEAMSESSESNDLVVLEDETLEDEFGWVFFYTSEAYVRTGDFKHAVAGNAPLIVERSSGATFVTGTAKPISAYIEAFRQFGDPHRAESHT